VQHNTCCVADAQLLSACVRNFHTDCLLYCRMGLVTRGMGLLDDLSPGILRHGLVSCLLHLGLKDVCLSRSLDTRTLPPSGIITFCLWTCRYWLGSTVFGWPFLSPPMC
jgi:hypothetical protein